jgi:hypothetical protein
MSSLARYVQKNIGPQSFCKNHALRPRSVQKRPQSDISLYRPRVRLIRSIVIPVDLAAKTLQSTEEWISVVIPASYMTTSFSTDAIVRQSFERK